MGELTSMRNIGREMARKLAAVGIDSPEKLTEAGAKEAFFRLKGTFPEVCLVHLYALEGAVRTMVGKEKDTRRNAVLRASVRA